MATERSTVNQRVGAVVQATPAVSFALLVLVVITVALVLVLGQGP
jgi:hypothetical protein